ncbi:hypothetical protein [Sphingomonas xinjiangensis]|uniref:Uncharacterized protein n=1 Tax=Sphingomonas xinjiangensis TaxID=643568 RepID=A0A840YTU7_9SPHN|nr:hypothetical protein [Sphingomonas xinjiangensis]MBB5713057.1 hypothetical protein [Sphingomonas xinjiangensis]
MRLLFRDGAAVVRLELTGRTVDDAGEEEDALSWEMGFHLFQAGDPDVSQPVLAVPVELIEDLRYRIELIGATAGEPVWLNLARPYGLLGTVPWERDLSSALGRSLLRLPDFPQRPGERSDVLENVVIVDPDPTTPEDDVLRRTKAIVDAILAGSSRGNTRVQIFPSAACVAHLGSLSTSPQVRIHDPGDAPTTTDFAKSHPDLALSFRAVCWSNWIGKAVAGRGIDAIHILCRAGVLDGCACPFLSCSPSPKERVVALVPVSQEELVLLLDRAGGWATSFAEMSDDADSSLRQFSDAFARARPGAVLYHRLGETPDEELAQAFSLLFAGTPGAPPMLRDGFLYCHPSFVRDSHFATADPFELVAAHAVLLAQRAPVGRRLLSALTKALPVVPTIEAGVQPGWLNATQRLLEAAAFEELRRSSGDVLLAKAPPVIQPTAEIVAQDSARTEVIAEIQDVISNFAKSHSGGRTGV